MRECETPGCESSPTYFSQAPSLKVCITCRAKYYSHISFFKIPDAKLLIQAVDVNSCTLNFINDFTNNYRLERLLNGFKDELNDFILKNEDIRKRLKNAEENDLLAKIVQIEEEIFELKEQIDSSEMMRNFTFHYFQINMECAAKGIINEEIKEDAHLKRLLTQAKENITQDFERRYEDRSTKRDKELKDEYEELYKTKIDEYKTSIDDYTEKIELQDITIRNLNSEIINIKDEINEKDAKIDHLTEESKTKDAKIELLEETNDLNLKRFFEFYKAKTNQPISDKFDDINFYLSVYYENYKQVLSVAKLFRLRLPAVKKLTVDYCESPNADLLEFLKNSSPTSTKFLSFGYNCDAPNTPINYYVDGLEVALKGVTQEIHMSRWSHSKESLQKLIKAGAGAERFILYWSQINFDSDLDFSGPEYKIKYFGIPYCGDYVGECWSSKPEKMERIIKAFGNCGIKDSLKTFNVCSCGITVENVKQMLSDNGMSLVNVVQENSVPSS